MNKTKKIDFALMNILKVHEISRIICETNMGVLKLQIRKGETEYRFLLDSVPLPKELHKEVYELLYAPEIPQVTITPNITIPKAEKLSELIGRVGRASIEKDFTLHKPKGRPKGSVNKIKNGTRETNS